MPNSFTPTDKGPRGQDRLSLRSKSTLAQKERSSKQHVSLDQSARTDDNEPFLPQPLSGQATAFQHVPRPDPFEMGKQDPILPCFSAKNVEQNTRFFGREKELVLIDKYLLPTNSGKSNDRTLRSFGICGMGGLGKTQIAIQYIYTRRTHFDAIFWLTADDKTALGENFATLAGQLGIEDPNDSQDLTVSRERVKEWLSNPLRTYEGIDNQENEASWLLVFDNADSLSVLDEFWPLTGRGSVLLTSRDPVAKTSFYTENCGIDLSKFSLEDTVTFLRSLTKSTTDSDNGQALTLIAKVLDGLPLGIEQLASIIRRLRVNYADFLHLYEKEGKRLHEMFPEQEQTKYQHSLATVWSSQQFSQGSETLLQVLSILDPDSVPESLLTENLATIDLEGYPADDVTYYDARGELLGASLISLVNQVENQKGLRLHRLLQDVVIARMGEVRTETVFKASLRLIYTAWPFQSLHHRHTRDRWNNCAELFSHVAYLKKQPYAVRLIQANRLDVPAYATLLNDAGW